MTRITVDLDDKRKQPLIDCVTLAITKVEKIQSIEIIKSNSKGWHLIIWSDMDYSEKQLYRLREVIGDDIHRIRNDKLRKIGKNTLFDYKKDMPNEY